MRRGAPKSKFEWIAEIAEAYRDAEEAIPFGPVTGQTIEEKDLFHFALDLVDEKQINEIMEHIEAHQRELAEAISKNG